MCWGDPITVSGSGSAHVGCYQTRLITERIFAGVNIAKLDDSELNELSDIVLMEKNSRSSVTGDGADDLGIELF